MIKQNEKLKIRLTNSVKNMLKVDNRRMNINGT